MRVIDLKILNKQITDVLNTTEICLEKETSSGWKELLIFIYLTMKRIRKNIQDYILPEDKERKI